MPVRQRNSTVVESYVKRYSKTNQPLHRSASVSIE